MTDTPPLVSVVIVNWNGGDVVYRCVLSLHERAPKSAWEVILVDNASSDGSAARIAKEFPSVRVIANRENRGLAAANNQGIAASAAKFVLISNPDVVYLDGTVDALLDLMDRRTRAAFAVARLLRPDGSVQTGAGDLPTLRSALLGRQWQLRRARQTGFWWDGWAHDEEVVVGHGMEACYLVRRAAIAEIGLQDERFRLDWEGIDWSARAHEAGWEIWYCPSAEVIHSGGVSLRQAQAAWILRSHQGMYRYFAKRSPLAVRPALAMMFAGRAAVKLMAARLGMADYAAGHPGSVADPN